MTQVSVEAGSVAVQQRVEPKAVDLSERDSRQRELVPPNRLSKVQATIIGIGAVGRPLALILGSMGVPVINLIDDDKVEVVNLNNQGFAEHDLGLTKVDAVGEQLRRTVSGLHLNLYSTKWNGADMNEILTDADSANPQQHVVFMCVDNIETRKTIWDFLLARRTRIGLVLDARMLGETLFVYSVPMSILKSVKLYGESFFTKAEATPGRCAAKSTLYAASIAAGLMATQMAKWLRDITPETTVNLSLTSMEMSTEG
jgi:sulfur carrier protein ThiS adenylyltransferase